MHHQNLEQLKALRLFGMARALEELAHTRERDALTFDDQLALLIEREAADRANLALTHRLRRAHLRQNACLENLDLRTPRGLDRTLVRDLASCRWVAEHRPILAHREQLRIVAPKLLADAVREAHALLLQLFSQVGPLPQRNDGRVAGLDGPEQVQVRAQSAGRDPSIAPVVLRPSQTDAVAQPLELLGINRVHGKAAVQESIHDRPVRHLNRHRDRAWVASHRHQPVTECREACTAMRERPLAHNRANFIEQAGLVLCRAPVDAGEPAECLVSHGPVLSSSTSHHDTCQNLYWRSGRDFLLGIRRGQPAGAQVQRWCSWHGCVIGRSRQAGSHDQLTQALIALSRIQVLVARVRNWSLPTGRLAPLASIGTYPTPPDTSAKFRP